MKSLLYYINEALRPEVSKWIAGIYDKMVTLVKEKKINTKLEVDVKRLAKPEKGGFEYDDFSNDKTIKNFIKNNVFGFTVINQMMTNPNKYLVNVGDTNEDLKPECLPYWYDADSNVYFIGLVMWDKTISYADNFATIVSIESSLLVDDSLSLLKAILNDFSLQYLNKKGTYKGLASKPIHPKMKAILLKLGFKPSQENKEILIYKL